MENEKIRKSKGFYTPLPKPKKRSTPLFSPTLGNTYLGTERLKRNNVKVISKKPKDD